MDQAYVDRAQTTMTVRHDRSRMLDIDQAKGFTIFLVVLGHIVSTHDPARDAAWYDLLIRLIYSFHMPFFMYLSGLVYFYTYKSPPDFDSYLVGLKKRANRLLAPFLIFSLLVVIGKAASARFVHVDHAPDSALGALSGLFWNTDDSPTFFGWYLVTLFVYSALAPWMMRLSSNRLGGWALVLAIVHFVPLPHYMYVDRIGSFFIYFVIGGLVGQNLHQVTGLFDRYRGTAWLVFLIAEVLVILAPPLPSGLLVTFASLAAIPALHALARTEIVLGNPAIRWLGTRSFIIYLLNTVGIGIAKAPLVHFFAWDGQNLIWMSIPLLAGGLFIPVLVKRYVFCFSPWLDKMTDS